MYIMLMYIYYLCFLLDYYIYRPYNINHNLQQPQTDVFIRII